MDITYVHGNNSWKFHDDTMMGTWWKHSQKVWQTDRRTENTICRAAWSQLIKQCILSDGTANTLVITYHMLFIHFILIQWFKHDVSMHHDIRVRDHSVYGSGHKGAAVLLPGFALSWLQNQVKRQPYLHDLTHMRQANERWHYIVALSLIGWVLAQNDSCTVMTGLAEKVSAWSTQWQKMNWGFEKILRGPHAFVFSGKPGSLQICKTWLTIIQMAL